MAHLLHSPQNALALLGLLVAELYLLRHLGDRVTGRILGLLSRVSFHKRVLFYILLAPGVALHELAHAIASLIAGCGIKKMVLFKPERQEGGIVRLGYVQPRYQARSIIGEASISLAPLLLPPLLLYVMAIVMVRGVHGLEMPQKVFAAALESLWYPPTLIWLFLFVSMTLSSFPSDTDFKILGWKLAPLAAFLLLPFPVAIANKGSANLLVPYLAVFVFLLPSLIVAFLVAYAFGWMGEIRRR
jgi:hypothetical protein